MGKTTINKFMRVFFVALLGVLLTASLASAASRRFIAYFGTETTPTNRSINNYTSTSSSPTDFNAANGQGGSMKLNNANMTFGTTYTGNANNAVNTISVIPDGTHQIKSVYYIRTDDLPTSNVSDWTNVTPSDKISTFTFNITSGSSSNRTWHIWVVFENRPVVATYNITGRIFPNDFPGNTDTTSAEYLCGTTGTLDTVTPPVATSVSVTGVAANATPTYYVANSNTTSCQVDKYSDDNGGSWTTANLLPAGGPYTSLKTDPITANYTFYVRFGPKQYTVTSTLDTSGTTTCAGATLTATNTFTAGSSGIFNVTLPDARCAISTVTVTDPNKGYTGANVTAAVIAAGNSYTFENIQANGSITVKLITVSTALGGEYCQVPPFIAAQSELKPNVLLIFDNSGSMAYYPYLRNSSDKPYTCDTTNKTTTAPTGAACTLSNINNFYGYFVKDQMYTYNSTTKKFTINAAASLNFKKAASTVTKCSDISNGTILSGNYLNYLCMQKFDIVKNILVGGKVDPAAGAARGAADGTTSFFLKTNAGMLVEYGKDEPQGLVHKTIAKVRFGMMTFNNNGTNVSSTNPDSEDGAILVADLGSDLTTMVTKIEAVTQELYTPLAESFYEAIRYYQAGASAYNSGVSYAAKDPIQYSCQKHFVLMLTDGEPTNDQNVPGASNAVNSKGTPNVSDSNVTTWYNALPTADKLPDSYTGISYPWLPRLTYYAHNNDLRTSSVGKNDITGKQNLTTYTVYAFGETNATTGEGVGTPILRDAAKYGAYTDANKNNKPDAGEYNNTYYEATDGDLLKTNLEAVFSSIISSTASGTAAAVANNKSGERGANMIQALFYPQWPNDGTKKWFGEAQAIWYYLDPLIGGSSIYEDSDSPELKIFDLAKDNLASGDTFKIKALWRAGAELQKATSASRNIYTLLNGALPLTANENKFVTSNLTNTAPSLKTKMLLGSMTDAAAGVVVNYVRGTDDALSYYRSRKVSFIDPSTGVLNTENPTEWKLGDIINSTPQVQSYVPINTYHTGYVDKTYSKFIATNEYKARNVVYTGSNDGLFHAFRLGNVVSKFTNSAPNLIAQMTGSGLGSEEWAFIPSNALPYIQNQAGFDYCHQNLVDGAPTVVDASIFKHDNTKTNYWDCERKTTAPADTLDPTKTTLDANNTSWRTVVVSSMGLGGASRDKASTCNETYNPDNTADNKVPEDCVKTPVNGDGLSSYFALDVSDPLTPKFMWEFSDSKIAATDKTDDNYSSARGLGFTTPGTAIVRINSVESGEVKKNTNGRWFAIMASGPTGPIDAANRQFLGRSDQNLKIYIVDLNSGPTFTKCTAAGQSGCNFWVKDTRIPFAFANSLNSAAIDLDRWNSNKAGYYSDDVVYITYTKAELKTYASPYKTDKQYPVSSTAWTKGGVVRLVTNNDPDPFNWFTSSLIDDVGPITTSIGKIQDRTANKLWVFFGEGRYLYPGDETDINRRFFGVADPCFTNYGDAIPTGSKNPDNNDINFALGKTVATCPAVSFGSLQNQTTPAAVGSAGETAALTYGWYINMDSPSGTAGAERVVSDVTASFNGVVFYTTFIPNTDVCTPGGSTSLWAVKYNSGGTPPASSMQGKAPVQTSSGGITLIDMATAFSESYGRKLNASLRPTGMAPKGRFPPLFSPRAVKRILSVHEQ